MFCSNCGKKLDKNVKFCGNCGQQVNVSGENNLKYVTSPKIEIKSGNKETSLILGIICLISSVFLNVLCYIPGIISLVYASRYKKESGKFGVGFGLSLAGMIISLLFSNYEDVEENKLKTYEIVQELSRRFQIELGTLSCEELLKKANLEIEKGGNPESRTDEYYKKRPCAKIVYNAAKILNEFLIEKEIIKE